MSVYKLYLEPEWLNLVTGNDNLLACLLKKRAYGDHREGKFGETYNYPKCYPTGHGHLTYE